MATDVTPVSAMGLQRAPGGVPECGGAEHRRRRPPGIGFMAPITGSASASRPGRPALCPRTRHRVPAGPCQGPVLRRIASDLSSQAVSVILTSRTA